MVVITKLEIFLYFLVFLRDRPWIAGLTQKVKSNNRKIENMSNEQ